MNRVQLQLAIVLHLSANPMQNVNGTGEIGGREMNPPAVIELAS